MTEALHLPDPPISLSGFRLRSWATTDVPALVAAWRDPEMARWMPEETQPFEAEQARTFIDDAATHLSTGKSIALAIADEATDQAVGSVSLLRRLKAAHLEQALDATTLSTAPLQHFEHAGVVGAQLGEAMRHQPDPEPLI